MTDNDWGMSPSEMTRRCRSLAVSAGFRDWTGIDDAVQDALLHALSVAGKFRPECGVKFATWITSVMRNKLKDIARSGRRAKRTAVFADVDPADLPGTFDGADAIAERKDLASMALRVIGGMAPENRDALEAMFVCGLDSVEHGNRDGISHSTIRKRRERGMRILREEMGRLTA